jgi:hypothetical protein
LIVLVVGVLSVSNVAAQTFTPADDVAVRKFLRRVARLGMDHASRGELVLTLWHPHSDREKPHDVAIQYSCPRDRASVGSLRIENRAGRCGVSGREGWIAAVDESTRIRSLARGQS